MRESAYNTVLVKPALSAGTHTTSANGDTVDLHVGEQSFRSVSFAVKVESVGAGTHTFTVEDSDDGVSFSAADASHVQNSGATATGAGVVEVGYNGYRRYVRLVATVSGATPTAEYGAVALLLGARREPVVRS